MKTPDSKYFGIHRRHMPMVAIFFIILLIIAWAAFFFPAFTTVDGLNK